MLKKEIFDKRINFILFYIVIYILWFCLILKYLLKNRGGKSKLNLSSVFAGLYTISEIFAKNYSKLKHYLQIVINMQNCSVKRE